MLHAKTFESDATRLLGARSIVGVEITNSQRASQRIPERSSAGGKLKRHGLFGDRKIPSDYRSRGDG